MSIVKTCVIKTKTGSVVINESDFDESKHELVKGDVPKKDVVKDVPKVTGTRVIEKAVEKPDERADPPTFFKK